MSIYIARNAIVATTPRHMVTADGLPITSFRVAESVRRYRDGLIDNESHTNWFTVVAFGALAIKAKEEILKGSRIDAGGNIVMRDWDNGEQRGTSAEIELQSYEIVVNVGGERAHKCTCVHCRIR